MQERTIRDVMTPNPSTLSADSSVAEAAKLMKREDVGVIPVVAVEEISR
jgi:CBS domain-containing protein